MPAELPYMPSVTNLGAILDKIKGAGTPPKFTHDFLKSTLGFGSSNDRSVIKVLRKLGFLDADSTPTHRYNDFKGDRGGAALALGLREGWADLFMADQKINEKTNSQIVGTAKSITGAGDSVAQKMAATFKTLSDKADWSDPAGTAASGDTIPETREDEPKPQQNTTGSEDEVGPGLLRLHQDVHVHLPPTSDVSVYRAIFQALKAELM